MIATLHHDPYRGVHTSLTTGENVDLGHPPYEKKVQRLITLLSDARDKGESLKKIELDFRGKAFIKAQLGGSPGRQDKGQGAEEERSSPHQPESSEDINVFSCRKLIKEQSYNLIKNSAHAVAQLPILSEETPHLLKNSPTIITPSRQIFALDLGTTKFCLATLRQNDGQKPEIEHVVVPSGGMRRGMVCDMNEARGALDTLIAQAESQFQSDIKHIYLGVAGSHLNGRIAQATLDLGGDTIRSEDQEAIQNKCQKPKDSSYEILHNIPLTYQVDQRDLVNCAVGFSGDFLKGESFIIEADKNYLKDLVRLCNTCGLTVLKLYAEPYASAMVSVPYERRQQGVVVADIGGGTTDGIVFKEGKPVKLFTVNVGGEIMTQDLATCLQIASADAHRLKHHFGLYHATHNRAQGYRPDEREKPSKRMAVEQITGRKVHISGHHVYKILSCRIVELYHLIMEELGPLADLLNSGMVITGGGSELGNIAPFISRQHSIYVNQIQPYLPKLANNTDTPHERITASTPYATVVGLLYLAWLHEEKHHRTAISAKATFHLRSFISWLKEIA